MCYSKFRIGENMKNIRRQIIVNILIIVVMVILVKGVSYSIDNSPMDDNKNLLIKTGNMQVVLNIPNEKYEFFDTTKLITSDVKGKEQDGYTFSITNTGTIPIEYYEIRMVDQENKISTLPHKYLSFIINKDNGEYSDVKNLGDNDSVLYSGYNLEVGNNHSFNLKMWINETNNKAAGKTLYGAIEVVLYQKYNIYSNYLLYESEDSTNIPFRTSINEPISTMIPEREGYKFIGWQRKNGEIIYQPGDNYGDKIGTTLYAIWEKNEVS